MGAVASTGGTTVGGTMVSSSVSVLTLLLFFLRPNTENFFMMGVGRDGGSNGVDIILWNVTSVRESKVN